MFTICYKLFQTIVQEPIPVYTTLRLQSLLDTGLPGSTPNHPLTHLTSLTQPLHDQILSNRLSDLRTPLLQHLHNLSSLPNLLDLFQTLQTLQPHHHLLNSSLFGFILVIFQTHRHIFMADNFGLVQPTVQLPLHSRVWTTGDDALIQRRVDVFAELRGNWREVSLGEVGVHVWVEGF